MWGGDFIWILPSNILIQLLLNNICKYAISFSCVLTSKYQVTLNLCISLAAVSCSPDGAMSGGVGIRIWWQASWAVYGIGVWCGAWHGAWCMGVEVGGCQLALHHIPIPTPPAIAPSGLHDTAAVYNNIYECLYERIKINLFVAKKCYENSNSFQLWTWTFKFNFLLSELDSPCVQFKSLFKIFPINCFHIFSACQFMHFCQGSVVDNILVGD